jgi:AefR-like transcriptional repressor, C-terminal domain
MPLLFQAAPAPSAERTAEVVDSATRMFLAAYGARTT